MGGFIHKFGTRKMLLASIISISISTLIMALLPNSPYSLFALYPLRSIQGMAFAVEFPTASLVSDKKVGLAISGATIGYIVAALLFKTGINWRIPFFISGVFGLLLSWIRLKSISDLFPKLHKILNITIVLASIISLVQIYGLNLIRYIPKSIFLSTTVCIVLFYFKLFKIQQKFIDNKYARFITFAFMYFFLVTQALALTMRQGRFVAANTHLASTHFHSLLFSLVISIISQLGRTRAMNIFSILALVALAETTINFPTQTQIISNPNLLLTNQLNLTILMISGLRVGSSLFRNFPALAPIAYNGCALIASVLFNSPILLKIFNITVV
jgi:MFS family permease